MPAWVAVSCNLLGAAVLVLLVLDPIGNLKPALVLLAIACLALYGTAFVRWWLGADSEARNDPGGTSR